MAIFKRATLQEKGLTDEQIEYVMNEAGRVFAGYTPNAEVKEQIAAALAEAAKNAPAPVKVEESEQYKKLLSELGKVKAFETDDFASVKKPYRDIVWEKLDHSEKHKPYAEQIAGLAKDMPDLFTAQEPPQPEGAKPQFGAQVQGQMPQGSLKPTLESVWFGKK